MAEDRRLFREAMDRIGLENPRATIVAAPKLASGKYDIRAGLELCTAALEEVGLPAIIRPAYTLGGTGGGVANNREEYLQFCRRGLEASPVAQILIDESLIGWKEFEMEVVRDRADNAIIVCSIENVDPMGVHTGDFDHRRAGADADRQGIPDHAQRLDRRPARDRGRDRRLERAVGDRSRDRPDGGDRDEPAGLAVLGAGVQGDRVPDRQDRRQAGRRLHAGRARQRHHQGDAGELRADDRLCGDQDPALRLREVPRRQARAHHRDEVGGRGDGDRPHRPRIDAEGAGEPRDRAHRLRRDRDPGVDSPVSGAARELSATERAAIVKALAQATPDRLRTIAQAMRHGLADDEINARHPFRPLVPRPDPRDRRGRGGPARNPACR